MDFQVEFIPDSEHIQQAWSELFPALRSSSYQLDNKPILERYTYGMLDNDYCEI
ncbi:hypothetical protein [Bacillus sp. 3255]|uniref:hypothetical protein n=1 Tax=Bacillus sp. 3255 TaxID=2817904 RepID=UPI00285BEDDE|nr:hypothetical protein [Bacillus sp. 3255]MDR6879976.1 DNA gyrase inhibitor GyrI [Bacillus sp. 3255]